VTWFLLSLGAAVMQASQFAVVKARGRAIPPMVIAVWTQGTAFVVWLVFFAVSGHPFVFTPPAWLAVAASGALAMGVTALLARASARGDISVVGPVFALSPIFTVLPDALLSGGLPSPLGWLGLALAVVGTGGLSGGAGADGSLRGLLRRPDVRDALGAAVLLGFLAAVDRWGALTLGPPSYLLCSHGAATALTGVIALATTPRGLGRSLTPGHLLTVVGHGLLGVTGTGLQTTAMTSAPAAYVNAIRRMSAIIAVLLGATLFREADVGRRLTAALLACVGAALLLLAR
jgi:drug/metabolite transporter (DMT)-like permease